MNFKFQRREGMPEALPGFEHIKRYWDEGRQAFMAKILPGQFYVSVHDEYITTVLGSCVSACIRDRKFGIGGMNHFMLPVSGENFKIGAGTDAERYGNYAMENMINVILSHGGQRKNLEVKVFGGGRIIAGATDIGRKNIDFVLQYIRLEGLELLSQDVGDTCPRKVIYNPYTGKAFVKRLRSLNSDGIYESERRYQEELKQKPIAGDVELF